MNMSVYIFYILLTLSVQLYKISLIAASNEAKSCLAEWELDQLCGSHTYKVVKPFLNHFQTMNTLSEYKDIDIGRLEKELAQQKQELSVSKDQLKQKEVKIKLLLSQIRLLQNTDTDNLSAESEYKSKFVDLQLELSDTSEILEKYNSRFKKLRAEFNKQQLDLKENQLMAEQLKHCQNEVVKLNTKSDNIMPNSCIPYRNFSGIKNIEISQELGRINVLCDSQTVGADGDEDGDGDGWMVIQQRINGKEDFYRNWTAYRNGFGSFEGDFFLGLEKLHQLTKGRQQELYIHMENFNGSIFYARYDNFRVESEEEDYKLSSLGKFSSNGVEDMLRWHEDQKFSTYDHENDRYEHGNCALEYRGGWWYKACASSNLNGQYLDVELIAKSSVYWAHYVALKKVKMLIRPKGNLI